MPISTDTLAKVVDLVNQIATETAVAQPENDAGLIPCFCMLGELADLPDSPPFSAAAKAVQADVDARLDVETTWDEPTLNQLQDLINWAQIAISQANEGAEPYPFEKKSSAAPEAAKGTDVPTKGTATEPSENQELKALATEVDVLLELNPDEDLELLQEFQTEAIDHLGQIEESLLTIEKDPDDDESLNSLFRSFHTLKGVSGFLHLVPLQKLAHELESVLDRARNKEIVLESALITGILRGKDAIEEMVGQITECLGDGTLPSEIVQVSDIIWEVKLAAEGRCADESGHLIADRTGKDEELPTTLELAQAMFGQPTDNSTDASDPEAPATASTDPEPVAVQAPEKQVISPQATPSQAGGKKKLATKSNTRRGPKVEESFIRVSTLKLDNLMDMVGELVIVQSQIHESTRTDDAKNMQLQRGIAQLSRISKELQHTSMALRMVPIKPTFQKASRMVRDIAAGLGKKVEFVTEGEDTELDRNVVEQIGDPLVHMIRNAIDHGLETTEERLQTQKPASGTVRLAAFHQGGSIVIQLSDDGRGLNTEKILQKAIDRGIVSSDAQMAKNDIEQLIFAPGFSTAEAVTDLSGRGVGMDVVRRNIENLRGSVEVSSEQGEGTTFRIKLPLTMAIIDGLVVRAGEERFILPTPTIKVALKPEAEQLSKIQGNVEVLDLRGKTLPIVRLHEQFGIHGAREELTEGILVIVETIGRPIALFVDEMVSKQEVVIKNLGSLVGRINGVAGGAILGDGSIALILDPGSLLPPPIHKASAA